jgi:hypothetical protein
MRKIYISVLIAIPIYFSFNSSAISKWKSCGGREKEESWTAPKSKLSNKNCGITSENPVKLWDTIWRSRWDGLIGFVEAAK